MNAEECFDGYLEVQDKIQKQTETLNRSPHKSELVLLNLARIDGLNYLSACISRTWGVKIPEELEVSFFTQNIPILCGEHRVQHKAHLDEALYIID